MKTRKRVLMVGKFFYPTHGGIEQHMLDHFRTLKDEIDFTLLAFNKEKKLVEENFEGAKLIRVPVDINIGNIPIGFKMLKYMNEYDGDIILIHAPNPIPMFKLLSSRLKKKIIVMHHYDITKQKILLVFYKPFLLRALKNADTIVATADNNVRFSTVLKKYRDKCKIIPLGIDPKQFMPSNAILEQASALKEEYPGKRVIFVGRLTYYKGIKYLISASENCSYHLFIIGSGKDEAQLRELAYDNDNIHFLNDIDDLLPYYYCSDLFVLPSIAKSEAFGIVQLEAMICGLPVITTNLPSGVPEVQINGETGYIVQPRDPIALREKIEFLLHNDDIRLKLGAAAMRRVKQHFILEMTKKQWLELYNE